MENKTEIILAKDGIYRGTTQYQLVGKTEDIIAEAASSLPTDLMSAFESPHRTRTHIRITRTKITMFCLLRYMVLNTVWRPYGEGMKQVHPHGRSENSGDFGATYQWNPPGYERYLSPERKKDEKPPEPAAGDMFVFYICTANKSGGTWLAGEVFLVATRKGDKKFYRLPLNNLHEDGRVCMGGGYQLQGKILSDQFASSLKFFEASPWNTDLQNSHRVEACRHLFSYDLKGRQKPFEGEWQKHCQAVNNSIYADLPGLIIP